MLWREWCSMIRRKVCYRLLDILLLLNRFFFLSNRLKGGLVLSNTFLGMTEGSSEELWINAGDVRSYWGSFFNNNGVNMSVIDGLEIFGRNSHLFLRLRNRPHAWDNRDGQQILLRLIFRLGTACFKHFLLPAWIRLTDANRIIFQQFGSFFFVFMRRFFMHGTGCLFVLCCRSL